MCCTCQRNVSWKPLSLDDITGLPGLVGYGISPTQLKYSMDDLYFVQKTIILLFDRKPTSCPGWVNVNTIRPHHCPQKLWAAYGRCFSRNDAEGLWRYEFPHQKDMFRICKTCFAEEDDNGILQSYLGYTSRHDIIYGPLDTTGITWLRRPRPMFFDVKGWFLHMRHCLETLTFKAPK